MKLYKFRSGDESIHGIVWAKTIEKAIELINIELHYSNETEGKEQWYFDKTFVTEIELGNDEKVIDFIDAYTF